MAAGLGQTRHGDGIGVVVADEADRAAEVQRAADVAARGGNALAQLGKDQGNQRYGAELAMEHLESFLGADSEVALEPAEQPSGKFRVVVAAHAHRDLDRVALGVARRAAAVGGVYRHGDGAQIYLAQAHYPADVVAQVAGDGGAADGVLHGAPNIESCRHHGGRLSERIKFEVRDLVAIGHCNRGVGGAEIESDADHVG